MVQDLVMGCLDDADDSIRLRALDLLSGDKTFNNLTTLKEENRGTDREKRKKM